MGVMIDGVWHAREPKSDGKDGAFKRPETSFRNWITADGSAGATGTDGFQAEPGRYHLYICHACPWAHRAMIFRALKGLEDVISVSVVHWIMAENGWNFADGEGVVPDPVIGADYLYQVYQHADSNFSGRITVPVLWDLQRNTIVSNESSEIIRMLNTAFNAYSSHPELDFYPEPLRAEIDEVNERIYHTLNNGVYRSGFATSQEAYNAALREGAVVPASQSWVNQDEQDTRKYASPPTSHSPSKPSRKHTSGEKNHNVTRKKSANTMQKELLALHQEGIKAGYVVAARPPSQPLHADKAAAAQAELQQMYLESLKQGTVGS